MDLEEGAAAELHYLAMGWADVAIQVRRRGCGTAATAYLQKAANLERAAASRATNPLDRAVLYRSAATLALEAGWPERARELAMRGLEGAPPDAIADELRGVLARC